MNCCDEFLNCSQGQNCPVRQAPSPQMPRRFARTTQEAFPNSVEATAVITFFPRRRSLISRWPWALAAVIALALLALCVHAIYPSIFSNSPAAKPLATAMDLRR
jgi:hypothetical protein